MGEVGSPVQIHVWSPRRTYRSAWLNRQQAIVDDLDVASWMGLRVTSPIRTSIDLARAGTTFAGVAALDRVLADSWRTGGADELESCRTLVSDAVQRVAGSSGVGRAREAASVATGLSESPAESIALVWFRILGIDGVTQQVVIRDSGGSFIARVDFLITQESGRQTVVEVDGALKYRSHDRDLLESSARASSATDAGRTDWSRGLHNVTGGTDNPLFEEKRREDRIRRLGYAVVRLTWADLLSGTRVQTLLNESGVPC
jgi:hypothetical protein